ncbi:MAG: hypothetical protein HWN68_15820 [Desulfobacterales bacterium]|nr:hypothetical protein [Desulfobacterales bacterium]
MNIFGLRNRLVKDYADYVKSFILIQDERIRDHVEENLENGFLWPDPLIQMNPSFEPGEWIDELVQQEILHEECSRIFRTEKDRQEGGKPLRLHRHQSDAVKAAKTGNNYVLTTGTGSGKSLAYEELLQAHRRVRTAARLRGLRYKVEPHLPPDVLGIYVYLPVI